jgi:hypothetical protein
MTRQKDDAYVLANADEDAELKRVRMIEANWDPKTARLGITEGRCRTALR